MRSGILDEITQALHDGGPREELAENVDLIAHLRGGKRLDKTFCGCSRGAVELRHLRCGRASQAQGFALGRNLAGEAGRERLGGVNASLTLRIVSYGVGVDVSGPGARGHL